MKKLYAIVISLLFVGSFFGIASVFGVQFTSFGANNYRVYDAQYNWIEIKDTGSEITDWGEDDDDGSAEIDIGFDFPFYGEKYNTLYLSTNGHIDFVEGPGNDNYNESPPPIYQIPTGSNFNDGWGENPLIAFFFIDMDFEEDYGTGHGTAYYKNFGDYFVIEYYEVPMYYSAGNSDNPTAGEHTMQVILYKNGNIKMQYKSLTYTTGYEGFRPVTGLDYDDVTGVSYDGPIRNGLALWYTTGANPDHKSLPMAQILKILKENKDN